MKIVFHGTGAGEGIPAGYCHCQVCADARRLGGKNLRTRTSVVINDKYKIDFPPDTHYHTLRDPNALLHVEYIFITHPHADHLFVADLCACKPPFGHRYGRPPLQLYGPENVVRMIRESSGYRKAELELHEIRPFERVSVEGAEVTALPAVHDPNQLCLLYKFSVDDRSYLHATDTRTLTDEVIESLADDPLDVLAFDCTHGVKTPSRYHGSIGVFVELLEKLRERNVVGPQTTLVATHFSHNGDSLHDRLVAEAEKHGILVAYDGMTLNVGAASESAAVQEFAEPGVRPIL